MPYIQRELSGEIIALFQKKPEQVDETSVEYIDPDHPDVISFISGQSGKDKNVLSKLAKSDNEIARVTEDLIALLIEKQVILFTELPPVVQQKLINRAKLRATLSAEYSNFLDDGESI